MEIRCQDGIDKATTVKIDRLKHTHLAKCKKMLNEDCKVSLKWRDLTGPEKLRLFKSVNLIRIFPNLPNIDNVQEIWTQ